MNGRFLINVPVNDPGDPVTVLTNRSAHLRDSDSLKSALGAP